MRFSGDVRDGAISFGLFSDLYMCVHFKFVGIRQLPMSGFGLYIFVYTVSFISLALF